MKSINILLYCSTMMCCLHGKGSHATAHAGVRGITTIQIRMQWTGDGQNSNSIWVAALCLGVLYL